MRTPNGLDAHPTLTRRLQHSDLTPDYHLLTNISTVNSKLGYPITLTPMSATSPATPSEQASLLSSAPLVLKTMTLNKSADGPVLPFKYI